MRTSGKAMSITVDWNGEMVALAVECIDPCGLRVAAIEVHQALPGLIEYTLTWSDGGWSHDMWSGNYSVTWIQGEPGTEGREEA